MGYFDTSPANAQITHDTFDQSVAVGSKDLRRRADLGSLVFALLLHNLAFRRRD